MRDRRNTLGAFDLLLYFDEYLPLYGLEARAHVAAKNNETVQPCVVKTVISSTRFAAYWFT
jgi:hypothetical protein